jgi:hypothetical protein
VKDRWGRTALDDAIAEGHWMVAKLLLSSGGQHTTRLDGELSRRIEETDLGEMRRRIRTEKARDQRSAVVVVVVRRDHHHRHHHHDPHDHHENEDAPRVDKHAADR